MTNEHAIAAYMAKGMTRQQACATLGVPYTPEIERASFNKDALKDMAIDTLAALVQDMQINPSGYKPSDIIAACKEALDRTEGKAVQTTHVNQNTTYTIIASIPAPPNSLPLMAQDIEGEYSRPH